MNTKFKNKRRDGLQRQTQIMSIALELFYRKGFITTSIDDIINACSIARGTFYAHFEGKDALLNMIIDTNLDMLFESLKVLDISIPEPIDEIKKLYLDVTQFLSDMPEIRQFFTLMLREANGLNGFIFKKINSFTNAIITMSAEYIKHGQENGRVINDIDPFVTSLCIVGSVKEILFHWLVLGEDIDVKNAITSTVDLFFRGMLNPI